VDCNILTALAGTDVSVAAFRTRLTAIHEFLQQTAMTELLEAELAEVAPTVRTLLESFEGNIEHVGLMASPGMSVEQVSECAAAAGFPLRPMSFPSYLVARELGSLSGAESAPTTIFRSSAEGTRSRRVGVEVFIPHVDEATIRTWIRDAVASHVAIEIKRPHDRVFAEIAGHFETAGFHVPAFLMPRPFFVPNPDNDLRTLYFDQRRAGERSRIEVFALGDLHPRPIVARRATDVPDMSPNMSPHMSGIDDQESE
jgi:hypothetical protein